MCLFTLHSSVIDFKFFAPQNTNTIKNIQNTTTPNQEEEENEVQTFTENGILVERKFVKLEQDQGIENKEEERKSAKKWFAHNITEYMFFNEFGRLEISRDSILETYKVYTDILKSAHKQLKYNYEDMAQSAFHGSSQQEILPLKFQTIKSKSLASYLNKDMNERLDLILPEEII